MSRAQNEVFEIIFLCIYLRLIGSMEKKKKTHQEFDFFILSYKKGKFLVSQILQGWNNIFF